MARRQRRRASGAGSGGAAQTVARPPSTWSSGASLAEDGCRYVLARHRLRGHGRRRGRALLRARRSRSSWSTGADPWAEPGGGPRGDELNGASLVAVVSVGSIDVLLPGDAEAEVLAAATICRPPRCWWCRTTAAAARSRPRCWSSWGSQAAFISVGEDNSFGHPDAGTVALLARAVGTVLRTDTAGWVSCRVEWRHDGHHHGEDARPGEREEPAQPLKPAYLIVGDDLPKMELALKRLKARIVEQSGSDLNIDEFDATVRSGRPRSSTPPTPWPSWAAPGWCWSTRCRPGSRPTRR